ncbi:MAG: Gfo/Idh/MocA family oxidoreductase [Thaumarchaeota archaeon]|nr:Gfo/Idh/MocA family oxidoreductase [Nitrososphaerota archaeon]
MPSKRLPVAVVGVGAFGEFHARAYSEDDRVELVGVADTNWRRARQVAGALGCRPYRDVATLLKRGKPELVSVATPDDQHRPVAVTCAEAGVNVLVEKPIAMTVKEGREIVGAARKHGVKLMVDFVLRFDSRYQKAKEVISEGKIGEILLMSSWRDVGVEMGRRAIRFSELCRQTLIHDIDIMRWIGGSEAKTVYGRAASKVLLKDGGDDAVIAIMEFKDGSIASLESNWVLPEKRPTILDSGLKVVGTEGSVDISSKNQGIEVTDSEGHTFPDLTYFPVVSGRTVGALRESLRHMVECVIHDSTPQVSGDDGLKALELAVSIRRSISENRIVRLR